jgi:hypothetical protein
MKKLITLSLCMVFGSAVVAAAHNPGEGTSGAARSDRGQQELRTPPPDTGRPQSDTTDAWQSDWETFAKEYAKAEGNVALTRQFVGKDVVWQGVVQKLVPPKRGQNTANVTVGLTPTLTLGEFGLSSVTLSTPLAEWPAWKPLRTGQKVVFRTRLTGVTADKGDVPIMFFRMNDGSKFAYLLTEGGALVRVLQD